MFLFHDQKVVVVKRKTSLRRRMEESERNKKKKKCLLFLIHFYSFYKSISNPYSIRNIIIKKVFIILILLLYNYLYSRVLCGDEKLTLFPRPISFLCLHLVLSSLLLIPSFFFCFNFPFSRGDLIGESVDIPGQLKFGIFCWQSENSEIESRT